MTRALLLVTAALLAAACGGTSEPEPVVMICRCAGDPPRFAAAVEGDPSAAAAWLACGRIVCDPAPVTDASE